MPRVTPAFEVPEGAPAWVTTELMSETWRTWAPRYSTPLTPEDTLEIILNVGNLMDVLERE